MEPNKYGNRADGKPKGAGFLGELKRPDGSVSTEVSIGVNIDGMDLEIPSLVPTLDDAEINSVLNDEMPDSVVEKATAHARERMASGKDPFHGEGDKPTGIGQAPWEKSWGDLQDTAASVAQGVQQAVKTVSPWTMSFGDTVGSVVKATKAVIGAGQGGSFDSVVQKLVGAESRGVHRNADGSLLTSPAGAQGIAQVMPKTAKRPGYGVKPVQDDSEEEGLRFGRDYLQAMLKEYDGDYQKAVAAYNAGPGSVNRAIKMGGDRWVQYLPKRSETIPYMNKILGTNHQIERRG